MRNKYAYLGAALVLSMLPLTVMAEETDYTSRIVNPSFEQDLTGWVNDGFQSQTNNSPSEIAGWDKDGNKYCEKWVSANNGGTLGNASVYQIVTGLPEGEYVVRVTGHAINQSGTPAVTSGTYIYTRMARTEVTAGGAYEVRGTVAEGTLSIGMLTDNTTANWAAVDNFRIYRVGEDVANYRRYLTMIADGLRAVFDDTKYRPDNYNKDAIDAAYAQAESASTKDEIFAALRALRAAEADFLALREAYKHEVYARDRIDSEITIAEMFYADSDYPGKAGFAAAIEAAKTVQAKSGATTAEYDAAVKALKEASAAYLAGRPSEWVRITNGAMWRDEQGHAVQAHGAGFLLLNDRYYMIGEDRSNSWNPDVNMYSSKDLVHWRFERKIIENGVTHPELGKSRMIERPKIMYNELTGKFVVWCHWEASNYGASEAGVFYSDVVNAPYTYHWGGRPMGIKSRDCNVYVDEDGTAYFISTTSENTNLGLFRLSEDYLEAVEHTVLFSGQRREAPAVMKHDGRYYMLSSACSGWDPNMCRLATTSDLKTGWTGLSNLGNNIAYDTQAASILKIQGSKATTYLYVGDRWQDPSLPESKTIIFPIEFADNKCTFNYVPDFEINFATGEWRPVAEPATLDKTAWTLLGCSSEETEKESGAAANAFDGDTATKWHTRYTGTRGQAPHYLAVDMGAEHTISGFRAAPRTDNSTNGIIRDYAFQVSADGQKWTTVSASAWMPYWAQVNFKPVRTRYFRLVAFSGDYAAVSEIDLFTGGDSYADVALAANLKIGDGEWQGGGKVEVPYGEKLTFGPDVTGSHGSWALECPDGSFLSGRECAIESVTTAHEGTYRAHFLDMFSNSHSVEYQISVDLSGVEEVAVGAGVIARIYYSLEGRRMAEPVAGSLYIVREIRADGTVRIAKVIY